MKKNFEAGGTILWGADYDCDDSDSEMASLTPIKESESSSGDVASDRGSYLDATSYTDSITASSGNHLRRRQSEHRTNLLRHKQLWQKAAQQAKQGSIEHRRKSILPFEDIGLSDSTWTTSTNLSMDDDDEEETSQLKLTPPSKKTPSTCLVTVGNNRSANKVHTKVQPISSLDIEQDVKPQLRAAREVLGFIFPRVPTQFTTDVNESLYQRYYSHKRKKTMLIVNILYIILHVALYILKLLPLNTTRAQEDALYLIRETAITAVLLTLHTLVCIWTYQTNSLKDVLRCAYCTWSLLLLHTLITPITTLVDYQQLAKNASQPTSWDSFGTWQCSLTMLIPFGFLTVIPLRRMIVLCLVMASLHLIVTGILTSYYNTACLSRVCI